MISVHHSLVHPFLEAALHEKKAQKPKNRKAEDWASPDLAQSKADVIGSLRSAESQRGYRHAIDEFIEWYCSDRGSRSIARSCCVTEFIWNRAIWHQAQSIRLAAVRRLAYEARLVTFERVCSKGKRQ